jgi:hypothetical protein
MRACLNNNLCLRLYALDTAPYSCVRIHVFADTHIHTHINTYIHTYQHTPNSAGGQTARTVLMMADSSRDNVITFPDTSGEVVTTTTMPTRLVTSSEYRVEGRALVLSAESVTLGKACADNLLETPRGSFMFTDGNAATQTQNPRYFESQNTFTAQASGGFRFITGRTVRGKETGAVLNPNASSWSYLSDRDAKSGFEHVNASQTLETLISRVPAYTWRYAGSEDVSTHMGAMAQDLHDAFGLGGDRSRIGASDMDGVLMSAVQGMQERVQRLNRQVADYESLLRQLQDRRLQQAQRLQAQNVARANMVQRAAKVRLAAKHAGLS